MSKKKNNKINEINLRKNKTLSNDFEKQLSAQLKGLLYISEIDSEVLLFKGQKAESVTQKNILLQIGQTNIKVEELSFEEFFEPLTKIEKWFGREERKMTESFSKIKHLLKENLRDLKVFKVGKIHLEIYIVGINFEGNLCGIHTKALET